MTSAQKKDNLPRIKISADPENRVNLLSWSNIHTVCEESRCPNRHECSSVGIATFLIGGRLCSRSCKFCHIATGKGPPLSKIAEFEKKDILEYAINNKLKYVVITSVTRDDDENGLALHFADLVASLNRLNIEVELLIPDFHANEQYLKTIGFSNPLVIAQNIETVERLSAHVRPQAGYNRTMDVFRFYKKVFPDIILKSGFMVGLGETEKEIDTLLKDLYRVGVEVITVGQYLQPSKDQLPVEKIYTENEFRVLEEKINTTGFLGWEVGHYVRSSYMASRTIEAIKEKKNSANVLHLNRE